jgi:hypothetical protein
MREIKDNIWKLDIPEEDKKNLEIVMNEEIDTDNLQFEDYSKWDHSDFLKYFTKKRWIKIDIERKKSYNNYLISLNNKTIKEKIAWIAEIEEGVDWIYKESIKFIEQFPANLRKKYDFLEYFIREHIEIDWKELWHSDLLQNLKNLSTIENRKEFLDKILFIYKKWLK